MNHYKTISELHQSNGFPAPENPLISIVSCNPSRACSIGTSEFTTDFYMLGFKKMRSGSILYGRTKYDHNCGSLSFVKPRQVIEIKDVQLEEDGFLMFVHEDFFNGHSLHFDVRKYGYFEYEIAEALFLSPKEERIIRAIIKNIELEIQNNQDEYSREIILGHIDSFLKYSQRFYKRQFINRNDLSGKTVSRFNELLNNYFEKKALRDNGLPSVAEMASQLNLSPRYLSDTLKQETGKTAMDLIHIFLISEAKNLLKVREQNVSEIAYSLGFENLPYFSRLFKKEVGVSPNQFKKVHLN
ncbi:MAG: helix-turn-helix transcriptional regulator [Cyclobacteriaceae bacterium]|nr:helix-turn-helix transcriptional regulator [Cyclobacteriaceae bacterium]